MRTDLSEIQAMLSAHDTRITAAQTAADGAKGAAATAQAAADSAKAAHRGRDATAPLVGVLPDAQVQPGQNAESPPASFTVPKAGKYLVTFQAAPTTPTAAGRSS